MLLLDDAPTRDAAARLGPYARRLLDAAAAHARRLHANEVGLAHFLYVMLRDEDSGAARLALGAFADPQTIAAEVLALSPGILVVGSDRSLPFSPGAVLALEAARALAVADGAAAITPLRLARAAHAALSEAGRAAVGAAPKLVDETAGPALTDEDGVLAALSPDARRALGAACRRAVRHDRDAITPAHLLLGALDVETGEDLRRERIALALGGLDADLTPLPAAALALDDVLREILTRLPAPIDTVAILERVLSDTRAELTLLFVQERVTPALVARVGTAYGDPR
ncbi:MAG: Clp protease N-terminal domain-containing protein [Planctomycetota bacterium]